MGVTLYELLAGRRPFTAPESDTFVLFEQIRTAEVPSLPETIPAQLVAIVRKCLAKKPEERYPTAEALAADLERWLAGEKVEATLPQPLPVPAPPSRDSRNLWRRRWIAAAVLLLVALTATILSWPKSNSSGNPLVSSGETGNSGNVETVTQKSPDERLAAGETIQLIGATGPPLLPTTTIPGCDSLLTTHRKDFCTLTSVEMGAAELWNKPLPFPVRFELEFATTSSRAHETLAGIYVGRKETPADDGLHQTLVWCAYREAVDQRTPGKPRFLAVGTVFLGWGRDTPTDDKTTIDEKIRERGPPDPGPNLTWQKLSVVIHPEELNCRWNGEAFSPVRSADVGPLLGMLTRRFYPGGGLQFTPPAFGPGLGLLIYRGEVVYRNAKLVPLPR
jgi:hypothetical protein